jgi:sporulation protein YlmC with PRC-barrel domain
MSFILRSAPTPFASTASIIKELTIRRLQWFRTQLDQPRARTKLRVERACVTGTTSAASRRPYRDGNYLPFRRWNQSPTALLFAKYWRNVMISKCLAIAFLATASVTGAALAQTATNQVDSTTSGTTHKEGEWRASKLAGVDVYNEANEKIGDINEVILDRSGKVANVILGVGGVLGLGEHYVAVAFDKLKWVDQPVTSTTASTTSAPANTPATTSARDATTQTTTGAATTTTTTTTTSASKRWYPDHAVYNATKDELKAMPEFKY